MKINISNTSFVELEAKAEEAAIVLGAMANPKRLMVLCKILEEEKSVNELAEIVNLSPAALSQHLSKLRALALVETRREGQIIHYRLASGKVKEILETLYRLYCSPEI